MPLPDRTFSDSDIVRIFCHHLTKDERNNVILFFVIFSGAVASKNAILQLLNLLPQRIGIRILVRVVLAALRIFKRTDDGLLSILFEGKFKRAVEDCIDTELKR